MGRPTMKMALSVLAWNTIAFALVGFSLWVAGGADRSIVLS